MNKEIIIHLPWPPSMNSYYSHTRYGVYLSKKGRLYKEKVTESVKEQCPAVCISDRMLIELKLFPPNKRKCDVDNYQKGLLDSLQASGLIENDNLIDQLFIYRGTPIPGGAVIVEICDAGPLVQYPRCPANTVRD